MNTECFNGIFDRVKDDIIIRILHHVVHALNLFSAFEPRGIRNPLSLLPGLFTGSSEFSRCDPVGESSRMPSRDANKYFLFAHKSLS